PFMQSKTRELCFHYPCIWRASRPIRTDILRREPKILCNLFDDERPCISITHQDGLVIGGQHHIDPRYIGKPTNLLHIEPRPEVACKPFIMIKGRFWHIRIAKMLQEKINLPKLSPIPTT